MQELYVKTIASKLGLHLWQVENCINLFEDGATIPFISRYRKERTGGLDEVAIAEIRHYSELYTLMHKRKESVIETIEKSGSLTPELRKKIENCVDAQELEDIYLPYRPKRRTKATIAKEAGLEPLADKIFNLALTDPYQEARKYTSDKVESVEDALSGARDIIAERISETATFRDTLRGIFRTRRIASKATKKADSQEGRKYQAYFDCSEPVSKIPPHRLLAMLRAENEGYISLKIDADAEKCCKKLYYDFCQERHYPSAKIAEQLNLAFEDAFKRLLEPSISNEVLNQAKEKADIE